MLAKNPSRSDSSSPPLALPWLALGGITIASLAFGFAQNSGLIKGGAISPPKILWLNFALIAFLVLPALLAFASQANPREVRLFKTVFASFAVRGVVELYLLYATDLWRCEYGIAHSLFTAVLMLVLLVPARGFGLLVFVTLWVESVMAWRFNRIADPAEGVFFAAPTAEFASINAFTWIAIAILYPWLTVLLIQNRNLFRRHV